MPNMSIVSQDEVSENQVIRSRVAETQQPDAERLSCTTSNFFYSKILVNQRVSGWYFACSY